MVEATQDDFKRFLKRLHPDPEVAWETYSTVWQKLMMFFQRNGCPAASDHADEALSRIARRDDLDNIRNFGAFAYGVARTMRSEIWEKMKKEVSLESFPGGTIPDGRNMEKEIVENIDRQRQVRCFRRCVGKLPPDERTLFLSFKLADRETRTDDRSKMAAQTGISAGTLRVRVFRIRREVERCARKCLISREKSLL